MHSVHTFWCGKFSLQGIWRLFGTDFWPVCGSLLPGERNSLTGGNGRCNRLGLWHLCHFSLPGAAGSTHLDVCSVVRTWSSMTTIVHMPCGNNEYIVCSICGNCYCLGLGWRSCCNTGCISILFLLHNPRAHVRRVGTYRLCVGPF
jgi:hypothetical protein